MNRTVSRRPAEFAAPWNRLLQGVSAVATVVLLTVGVTVWVQVPAPSWARWLALVAVLAILAGSALFTVRGYRIAGRTLLVKRLFWWTVINLDGLREAKVDPQAMSRVMRICGNGGLFSFSGWYWSKRLGRFRAYTTDFRRAVVLTLNDRTIVLSPERPEEFIETLRLRRHLRS